MPLSEFQTVGRTLFRAGLITGSSGNLSIRLDSHLLITRHGSGLNALTQSDLIETGIDKNDAQTPLASSELPVHRAIYKVTKARAIVHSHAPHAVALSLSDCAIGGVPVLGISSEIMPGCWRMKSPGH